MPRTSDPSRPTLASVAHACGVSSATVSRVLRGDTTHRFSASPEVRDRIMQMAEQMNYRPNITAQSLRIQQTHVIAVLGLNHQWSRTSDVSGTAVSAAVDVLHDRGYSVCTCFPKPNPSTGYLPPWRVDGYLLVGVQKTAQLDAVQKSGIPYVGINTRVGEAGYACQVNDEQGMQDAIDYLCKMGHTHIAYRNKYAGMHIQKIQSLPSNEQAMFDLKTECANSGSDAIKKRHSVFTAHIHKHQLPLLSNHDSQIMHAVEFLRQAVSEKATAIVTYSLVEAIDLYQAAYEMNIKIPDDMSILSFNNEYPSEVMAPPLTVMGLPTREMGRRAATMLVDLLEERPPRERICMFSEELVTRQSVRHI
jgi:LacI family transcriptional regulator